MVLYFCYGVNMSFLFYSLVIQVSPVFIPSERDDSIYHEPLYLILFSQVRPLTIVDVTNTECSFLVCFLDIFLRTILIRFPVGGSPYCTILASGGCSSWRDVRSPTQPGYIFNGKVSMPVTSTRSI